jgi:hypothetical protein
MKKELEQSEGVNVLKDGVIIHNHNDPSDAADMLINKHKIPRELFIRKQPDLGIGWENLPYSFWWDAHSYHIERAKPKVVKLPTGFTGFDNSEIHASVKEAHDLFVSRLKSMPKKEGTIQDLGDDQKEMAIIERWSNDPEGMGIYLQAMRAVEDYEAFQKRRLMFWEKMLQAAKEKYEPLYCGSTYYGPKKVMSVKDYADSAKALTRGLIRMGNPGKYTFGTESVLYISPESEGL